MAKEKKEIKSNQLLLSSLDVCLAIFVLLLLSLMSVYYDADKGIGDYDFVEINALQARNQDVAGDTFSNHFFAVVLSGDLIQINEYNNAKLTVKISLAKNFSSVREFIKANRTIPFVIYEQKKSRHFEESVRELSKIGVTFGVAAMDSE